MRSLLFRAARVGLRAASSGARVAAWAALAVACAARPSHPPAAAELALRDRLVIVASIDGFPASAFADPLLPVPTLRRLAREGAAAERMTAVNPTTTWANHATIATGVVPARHGVLHNGALLPSLPGEPLRIEQRLRHLPTRVPTLFDHAHAAGLRTAHVGWPPPQSGPSVHGSFPDPPDPSGATERALVAAGVLGADELARFTDAPVTWRDEVATRAAIHLVTSARPNLLLFHLLASDWLQHQHGPRGLPASAALALADARLGQLLRAVEAAGLAERTTILVVSDHGFRRASRSVRPNAALAAAGLLTAAAGAIGSCDVQAISFGGVAMIYVRRPERRAALTDEARARLAALEGVAAVVEPAGYAALGLPALGDDDEAPDLLLVARPGYAFSSAVEGPAVVPIAPPLEPGHHGYLATDLEMDALFVAWGRGVRRGVTLPRVANVDVAPTVARLLGLSVSGSDGRALTEILTP